MEPWTGNPVVPNEPGRFNPVIWLAEGERDIPGWLISGSERIRAVAVPEPDADERTTMARLLRERYGRYAGKGSGGAAASSGDTDAEEAARSVGAFARAATGLSLRAMEESVKLARSRGMPFTAMPDAVRIYRLGVEKNPWSRGEIRRRILDGEDPANERSIPGGCWGRRRPWR